MLLTILNSIFGYFGLLSFKNMIEVAELETKRAINNFKNDLNDIRFGFERFPAGDANDITKNKNGNIIIKSFFHFTTIINKDMNQNKKVCLSSIDTFLLKNKTSVFLKKYHEILSPDSYLKPFYKYIKNESLDKIKYCINQVHCMDNILSTFPASIMPLSYPFLEEISEKSNIKKIHSYCNLNELIFIDIDTTDNSISSWSIFFDKLFFSRYFLSLYKYFSKKICVLLSKISLPWLLRKWGITFSRIGKKIERDSKQN